MSAHAKSPASAASPQPAANAPAFASELTPIGAQTLVPGVKPITQRDRLDMLAAAPMQPRRAQRAADHGLFDMAARNQIEMFQPIPPVSG